MSDLLSIIGSVILRISEKNRSTQKNKYCHQNLPRGHRKMAVKNRFLMQIQLVFSRTDEKSFGSVLVANCTYGKAYWRSSVFKLHYSSSESGS